ncbi:D-threonate kinase [Larkinella harenae]
MIAVIADDFTGAAEIGGVGLRNGFRVVIDTKVDAGVKTDILVIATDTRSQTPDDASTVIETITRKLLTLQPDFVYKKIDSILRGNVGKELLAQMQVSEKKRALLIPANPVLKRTIENGIYYYDGMPLNEFSFTHGSVKKRTSARVLDLIGEKTQTSVLSTEEDLPEKGLVIGNTASVRDLDLWTQKIDAKTVAAGGSGFFDAILRNLKNGRLTHPASLQLGKKKLYVCGSAFAKSRMLVRAAKEAGQAVVYMPEKIFVSNEQQLCAEWQAKIIEALAAKDTVIIAVDGFHAVSTGNLPTRIREIMAEVTVGILKQTSVDELLIEGGSTSFSILQKLGYTRFYPTHELGPGTIRMQIEEEKGMFLTLKPGSYAWPASIWDYSRNHQFN